MAKRTVTMPDGTRYELDITDANLTDRQIMDNVSAHHKKQNADAYAGVPSNYRDLVLDSEKNANDYGGQKPGALKQFGLGMLHSLDKQLAGVTGFFGGNSDSTKKRLTQGADFVNQYGPAASIGGLVGDIGGDVATAIGTRGMGLGSRMGWQGVSGALRTPGDGGDRAVAGLINAGGEGVGSLLSATLRGGLRATEPFTAGGRDRIINRTLNGAYSGEGSLIDRITNGNVQLVPGINPTTAQAAMDPGISQLSNAAQAKWPAVSNALSNADTLRHTGYSDAMTDIAGSADRRGIWEGIRKDAADVDFPTAYAADLLRNPTLDATAANLFRAPFIKSTIPDALKRAETQFYLDSNNVGKTFAPDMKGSVFGVHNIIETIQDKTNKAMQKDGMTGVANTFADARDALTGYLRQASPAYGTAIDNYASNSVPLNQMAIGKKLYETAFPAINDSATSPFRITPNQFSHALRNGDDLVKRETGLRNKSLEEVMGPYNMGIYNGISADMTRAAQAGQLGMIQGSRTAQLGQNGAVPNVIHPALEGAATGLGFMHGGPVGGAVVNSGLNGINRWGSGRIGLRMADALSDPNVAADILRRAHSDPNWFMRNIAGKNTGVGLGAATADSFFNYMPNQYPLKQE
jgi:hypothetical protein